MSTFTFRDLKLYYVTFFIKQNIKLSHLWNHKSFRRSAPWISACKAFSICVNWERFWERFSRKNCVITLPAITARVIQLPGNHSASWSGVGGYGNHISFRPSSLYKSRLESPARSAGQLKWSISPEKAERTGTRDPSKDRSRRGGDRRGGCEAPCMAKNGRKTRTRPRSYWETFTV